MELKNTYQEAERKLELEKTYQEPETREEVGAEIWKNIGQCQSCVFGSRKGKALLFFFQRQLHWSLKWFALFETKMVILILYLFQQPVMQDERKPGI